MKDYRILTFNNKDMINAEVKRGKAFKYLQFLENKTGDFYCIYSKVHGAKSTSVVRIRRGGDIFHPDRGTWIKHKNKYIVNMSDPMLWYK